MKNRKVRQHTGRYWSVSPQANKYAHEYRSKYIGLEHLLLACLTVLRGETGLEGNKAYDLQLELKAFLSTLPPSSHEKGVRIQMTETCRKVMRSAEDQLYEVSVIDVHHILLTILGFTAHPEGENIQRTLDRLGIRVLKWRRILEDSLRSQEAE